MANPIQQAAVRRKAAYLLAILALFTVSIFWRGKLAVPFANQVAASRWLSDRAVLARAEMLDLRELDQGDPEILGSALRLGLTGSRGLVVTVLWKTAIDKQARNEWHEFEIAARTVTRLQPNFITPWLFQSWNISYNVSVENDKLGDMYFYIARGIELLAEGDRLNTKTLRDEDGRPGKVIGSPDLRHMIGFYYQNKFGVSDKVQTLRCLAQLSGIPPAERSAQRDATGRLLALPLSVQGQGIDPVKFRDFCLKNPQLVRRLRTRLNLATPEEVVQFLADNERVPSLYKNATELADPADQFPVLPPEEYYRVGADEYTVSRSGQLSRPVDDTFDAFDAARSWFGYSCTVVPPGKTDRNGQPLPWASPRPSEYDQFKYRVPRAPALIVFRQQPARAQTYLAERLAKEGWFDETSGWSPDDRVGGATGWFPPTAGGEPVVLTTPATAKAQWDRAWRMWNQLGEETALQMSGERLAALREMARKVPVPVGVMPPDYSPEELKANDLTQDDVDAARALVYLEQNRNITNFDYFLSSTDAERDDLTVAARKLLWEADQARQSAENARAVRLYTAGLAKWREVLRKHKRFHRPERSDSTEESTYEMELALISLLKEDGAVRARADRVAEAARAIIPALPDLEMGKADLLQAVAEDEAGARVAGESLVTLFPSFGLLTPERRAAQRVNTVVDTVAALGGPLAADPVRAVVVRGLIESEFPWLKDRRAESQLGVVQDEDYWVRPSLRESVKGRLGLIRKAPAGEVSDQPTADSAQPVSDAPPAPPGRKPRPEGQ